MPCTPPNTHAWCRGSSLTSRQKNAYVITKRKSVVSGEDLWLGLGVSKSLAGLDGDARIFHRIDRRRALGEEGAVDFFRLQPGTGWWVGGDCLLERREATLVLGKAQITKEPIVRRTETSVAILPMPIITTLNFSGRTEEALKFYTEALNAETVFLMRFWESPDQSHSQPGMGELIFHATFRIEGTEFMASDVGYAKGKSPTPFSGFSLALQLSSAERAKQIFSALSRNGRVVIPLAESAFTSWYGIVLDRFGVSWKINVDAKNG